MKCIKNHVTGEVKRVTEAEAIAYVAEGWRYVAKAEWRKFKAGGEPKLKRAIRCPDCSKLYDIELGHKCNDTRRGLRRL